MRDIKKGCTRILIWILVFIIVVLLSAGIGAGAVYLWQRNESEKARIQYEQDRTELNNQINDLRNQLNNQNTNNNNQNPTSYPLSLGTIEGSLSYPSSFIPKDMKVCAQTLDASKKYCTSDHIKDSKYTYGEGYKLNVPAGTYYVYAYITKTDGTDWKAYYNKFVTCGLAATCPSHEKIAVEVKAGDSLTKIDPQDWYETI